MRQWIDSLQAHSNLPRQAIGGLGGGLNDSFSEETRILICVLNSASTHLAGRVCKAAIGEHLLLVVDECHRATGQTMSKIFETPRAYNLGLSATPEREEPDDGELEKASDAGPTRLETEITDKLGPIIYELKPAVAIQAGILSTFEFRHYGLPLGSKDRAAYNKLSREIRELGKKLRNAAARSRGGSDRPLSRIANTFANRPDSALSADATQYLANVRRRKNLLYRAGVRTHAVQELIRSTIAQTPEARILVFHESISQVMQLYDTLLRSGYRVTVDHSKLPDSLRADSIALFRSGAANILISARALIEGFDVPSADVGIIAAASASARQRIQTIGRLLRRPRDGSAKRAIIHTLYIAGTVDEAIYEKMDWSTITGADQDLYFSWLPPEPRTPPAERSSIAYQPQLQPGPPRRPRPSELAIDWDNLRPGDRYPGRFEGAEYQCDEQGNVLDPAGRPVTNPQGVPNRITGICGMVKRFKVTPTKRALLCWDRQNREVRFAGFLDEPFRISSRAAVKAGEKKEALNPNQAIQYKLQRFRGQRRIKNYAGRVALHPDLATNHECGEDALRVIAAIEELEKRLGTSIRHFNIEGREAYCIVEGTHYLLCQLTRGLEFR